MKWILFDQNILLFLYSGWSHMDNKRRVKPQNNYVLHLCIVRRVTKWELTRRHYCKTYLCVVPDVVPRKARVVLRYSIGKKMALCTLLLYTWSRKVLWGWSKKQYNKFKIDNLKLFPFPLKLNFLSQKNICLLTNCLR